MAAELELKPARHAGRQTVVDLLDAWRALKDPSWAPYTRRDQAGRARSIGEDRIGSMPVARVTVADVDDWVGRLRRKGIGEGSIRNQVQTLRSAFAQGVRWGWVSTNPAALATHEQPKRTVRGVMSTDEVLAVLDAVAEVHDMAPLAMRLAAVTGARRAELAALRWDDIIGDDLVIDSVITVIRAGEGEHDTTVLRDTPTKTGDRRRLALDEDTVALLAERRSVREALGPWLFSEGPEPPNPDRIGYWWKRGRDLADIDRTWRLHDLRHWSATTALDDGYDLATVAGRLGHSDASTTLRVYAHALHERDASLAASLAAALRPSPVPTPRKVKGANARHNR